MTDDTKFIIFFLVLVPVVLMFVFAFVPTAQENAQADALEWAKEMHPSKDVASTCSKPAEASSVFDYRWNCRLRIDKNTSKILSCKSGVGCRLIGEQ